MISIDKRKKIFTKYFIEFYSIRKISKELNISRSTVSKIIDEQRINIKKHNLINEDDLSKFMDLIVHIPKRKERNVKKYKVRQLHIDIIKELVNSNELNRTIHGESKTNLELFYEFKNEVKYEYEGEDIPEISYSTFYNLVKEVKKITY